MKISNELKIAILPTLLKAVQKDIQDKSEGLCGMLADRTNSKIDHELFLFKEQCFESWKHYSGWLSFPIASDTEGMDAGDKYLQCKNKWDKRTKYGRLRFDLTQHMINCID